MPLQDGLQVRCHLSHASGRRQQHFYGVPAPYCSKCSLSPGFSSSTAKADHRTLPLHRAKRLLLHHLPGFDHSVVMPSFPLPPPSWDKTSQCPSRAGQPMCITALTEDMSIPLHITRTGKALHKGAHHLPGARAIHSQSVPQL